MVGDEILNKKITIISIIIFFIVALIIFQSIELSQDDLVKFPVELETLQKALIDHDMLYEIVDSEERTPQQIIHHLKDLESRDIIFLSSSEVDGMKKIQLNYHDSNEKNSYANSNIMRDDWNQLLNMVSSIFNSTTIPAKVLKNYDEYILNREHSKYGDAYWHFNYKTIYGIVKTNSSNYTLSSIILMNKSAYENELKISSVMWKNKKNNNSQIIKKMDDANNNTDGIITTGYLENILNVEENDFDEIMNENLGIHLYYKDYLSANLISDNETYKVYVKAVSLENDDLNLIRKHFITYYHDPNLFIIDLSIEIE